MKSMGRVFSGWLSVFAIWIAWESAIRIFHFHNSWTPSTALSYFAENLLFFLVVAAVLACSHWIILLPVSRIRQNGTSFLTAICAAATFLLTVPIFLYLRVPDSASKPAWLLVLEVTGLFCFLFIFLFWILRFASRHWKISNALKFIAALILTPLILIAAIQGTRDHRFERLQNGTGGIRYIVLISIDTLRYDYVGAYGANNARTPAMDAIASEGALFENAISSIPQTGPSHTSMLTGKPPLVHVVLTNGQLLPPHTRTLAHELRDNGFRTAAFVSGYPLKAPNCGLDPAFQIYNDRLAFIDRFEEIYLAKLASLLPIFDFGVYRQAHEVTGPALQWLSENADHPFFLFLHYYDPHYPYGIKPQRRHSPRPMFVRIPRSDVMRQRQLYAKEVEAVDSQMSRVIALLKERGIYDQTLLIVTADHGESLGEHNYYYDHKNYVYEQLIRVPLLLRCPANIKSGARFKSQVALFDIYRTILNAAGISPITQTDAFDLIQLIQAPSENYSRKIISHNYNYSIHSFRTDRWKLIETKESSRTSNELFDLSNDPGELVNLVRKRKEITDQLLTEMNELLNNEKGTEDWNTGNLTPEQREALRSLGYLN